jgi:hypothetical protein
MPVHLQPGDVLPGRRLPPLGGGAPVKVGSPNAGRSQVVVAAHADPCDECAAYLRSFEAVTDRLVDESAEVVGLVGRAWDGQAAPSGRRLRVVVDEGALGRALAPDGTPVVVVADRFGQVFARTDAGPGHDFPDHERLLRILLDIAIRCPECGVPDVPGLDTMPESGASSGGMRLGQG